jgi:large subunit ribosomal protein L6
VSRIGKSPIEVPSGVDVTVDGRTVTVKGPKGQLTQTFNEDMKITLDDGSILVERPSDEREHRSLHGLTRSLIANMVTGVSEGFSKSLEIVGVGYRAQLKGKDIEMQLGLSHPVVVKAEDGITFEVPSPNKIVVSGIDKQRVGQIAAEIRDWRRPEPYKGKGIRYEGEYVRRKVGKTAAAGAP